jgi:hypothetical protein
MILLSAVCLIGILIGLNYNVLAVVPVTLAAVLIACVGATASGDTFSAIVLTALLSAIGLQGGYMIGVTARGMLAQLIARLGTPQSKRV